MARQRYYTFRLSDSSVKVMTYAEAIEMNDEMVQSRIKEIRNNLQNKRMRKDGFEPGWQENIQEYVSGRREYDKLLREKGLVEIGYEHVPRESVLDHHPCATEEFAKGAREAGVELSDSEVDAIKTGDYFKE